MYVYIAYINIYLSIYLSIYLFIYIYFCILYIYKYNNLVIGLHTSCAQVLELPQSHFDNNQEGTLFS